MASARKIQQEDPVIVHGEHNLHRISLSSIKVDPSGTGNMVCYPRLRKVSINLMLHNKPFRSRFTQPLPLSSWNEWMEASGSLWLVTSHVNFPKTRQKYAYAKKASCTGHNVELLMHSRGQTFRTIPKIIIFFRFIGMISSAVNKILNYK